MLVTMLPERHHVLTLQVRADQLEEMSAGLVADGFSPVEVGKPGAPVGWLELYFEDPVEAEIARTALGADPRVQATAIRVLERKSWEDSVRAHFKRTVVGGLLEICPVWEQEVPAPAGTRRILINPGLSFGTGNHFTTRFCLEMVAELCGKPRHGIKTFLDLGTGSAILAIAAAKLGVPSSLAIDNDDLAIEKAIENTALNGVSGQVELTVQDLLMRPVEGMFDLVVANIYTAALLDMAPWISRCVGSHLVLSGIREGEADAVAEAFVALGGTERTRDGDGEWAGLCFSWGPRRRTG